MHPHFLSKYNLVTINALQKISFHNLLLVQFMSRTYFQIVSSVNLLQLRTSCITRRIVDVVA